VPGDLSWPTATGTTNRTANILVTATAAQLATALSGLAGMPPVSVAGGPLRWRIAYAVVGAYPSLQLGSASSGTTVKVTLAVKGSVSMSGTFQLSALDNAATKYSKDIPTTASAAMVRDAIHAFLPSIGPVAVTRSQDAAVPTLLQFSIIFLKAYAPDVTAAAFALNTSKLTGTLAAGVIARTVTGSSPIGGSFTLAVPGGGSATTLAATASASQVATVLRPFYGDVFVKRTADPSGASVWRVTLPPAATNKALPTVDGAGLTGGSPTIDLRSVVNSTIPLFEGDVTLGFRGRITAPLDLLASSEVLEARLTNLTDVVGKVRTFAGPCLSLSRYALATQNCSSWVVVFKPENADNVNASMFLRHIGAQQRIIVDTAGLPPTLSAQVTRVRVGYGFNMSVQVSNNGADFSPWERGTSPDFSYFERPTISSVAPDTGPETGGTLVTVTIAYNASDPATTRHSLALRSSVVEPSCRFDESSVPAQLISSVPPFAITCLTPAHAPGSTQLSVSFDGNDYAVGPMSFKYVAPSYILRVSPRSGPVTGGTRVSILGMDFVAIGADQTSKAMCRFGDSAPVFAVASTRTAVTCIAPASVKTGQVSVDVSFNGQDYTGYAAQFTYEDAKHVTGITPPTGPALGGTRIIVRGTAFTNASSVMLAGGPMEEQQLSKRDRIALPDMRCKVGNAQVPAIYLSPTSVICTTPPLIGVSEVQRITLMAMNKSVAAATTATISVRRDCTADPSVSEDGSATSIAAKAPLFAQVCVPRTTTVPIRLLADAAAVATAVSASSVLLGAVSVSASTVPASLSSATDSQMVTITWELQFSAYEGDMQAVIVNVSHPLDVGASVVTVQEGLTADQAIDALQPTAQGAAMAAALGGTLGAAPGTLNVPVEVSFNGQDFTADGATFTYAREPRVTGLVPHHGPVTGGTRVRVGGTDFPSSKLLVCIFGGAPQDAPVAGDEDSDAALLENGYNPLSIVPVVTYISATSVECISPPQLRPGSVPVRVGAQGAYPLLNASSSSWGASDVVFTYDAPVVVRALEPDLGPALGGTLVRVVGAGFLPSTELTCAFGESKVQAIWIDGTTCVCTAPTHAVGPVPLEISVNGQQFSQSRVRYNFHAPLSISYISPVLGPAVFTGTEVAVQGQGFMNTSSLFCRFADAAVPARFVSTTEIVCSAPQISGGFDWRNLLDHETVNPNPLTGSRRMFPFHHLYPYSWSRLVRFDVSNNAQDYTVSGLKYLYYADSVVTGVYPREVRNTGTVPIFVTGYNFMNTTLLRCRIGAHVVPATFITPSLLLCFTPQRSPLQPAHGLMRHGRLRDSSGSDFADQVRTIKDEPGVVFVEVANNGLDFTFDRKTLEYLPPCPPGHYCPTHEASDTFECPRGSYCPGTGNANFTLCPRGTYQPRTSQVACLRCPIGYFCPDFGMYVPRICPAGFVCDVTGLERAEQPCPEGHFCLEGTATTATTCGNPFAPSSRLVPTLSHAEMSTTLRRGRKPQQSQLTLGSRNTACWDNSTTDFGLQASRFPGRFWSEVHLLPLTADSAFTPIRGKYCLDDRCLRLGDEDSLSVTDALFNYASQAYALRRPVPCPEGTFCHPGTAVKDYNTHNLTTPQPCIESMYCPEGSTAPSGFGEVPAGFYSPYGVRMSCPAGTYCPFHGSWEPFTLPARYVQWHGRPDQVPALPNRLRVPRIWSYRSCDLPSRLCVLAHWAQLSECAVPRRLLLLERHDDQRSFPQRHHAAPVPMQARHVLLGWHGLRPREVKHAGLRAELHGWLLLRGGLDLAYRLRPLPARLRLPDRHGRAGAYAQGQVR
jgi:hypothetical protein